MRIIALIRIAEKFAPGKKYTEKEVNEIIKDSISFTDVELIRREMYQYKFINRLKDGSEYWTEPNWREAYAEYIADTNEMNHPKEEPEICDHLYNRGVEVSKFLKNKSGNLVTIYDDKRVSHVQKFIEGKVFSMNGAADWFMVQSPILLGKIHNELRRYKELPMGIGQDFFRYMTPESARNSYLHSYEIAKQTNQIEILEDLEFRITRSFFYAEPTCADGSLDKKKFQNYVDGYCSVAPLTQYDRDNLLKLYFYQLAVCDYYAQYLSADEHKKEEYLVQARFATNVLRNAESVL